MKDENLEFIDAKWILRTKLRTSMSSAYNLLADIRKFHGVKPYQKVSRQEFEQYRKQLK